MIAIRIIAHEQTFRFVDYTRCYLALFRNNSTEDRCFDWRTFDNCIEKQKREKIISRGLTYLAKKKSVLLMTRTKQTNKMASSTFTTLICYGRYGYLLRLQIVLLMHLVVLPDHLPFSWHERTRDPAS